jgi:hypothetical protein
LTTSMPSTTLPNTTCLPSSHGVATVHRKNCDPLVLGPAMCASGHGPALQTNVVAYCTCQGHASCSTASLQYIRIPALAIDRTPGPVCLRVKFSSANFEP